MAAIPRPNTLVDHQIIWWTPTIGDFACPPLSGPVAGLGKLCQPRYNELRTSVIFLNDRATKYKESTKDKQNAAPIQPSVKWIQQVLDQLYSVQMSFRHLEFIVRDLQRVWLHVWGVLDYMEIYKPRMDGLTPPGRDVADTIGTFTTSIRVAQDMFLAGLPCWLIRPSSSFGVDDKIFSIAEIFPPNDYVVLEPHKFNYPVIFKGGASDLEKYRVIEIFARNFLCSRDPFAMTSTPSSLAGASQLSSSSSQLSSSSSQLSSSSSQLSGSSSQPSTLTTPAVASSSGATQHSTGRNSRGVVRRPARGHGVGKSSALDILIYYHTKLLLKVLVNRPVIMGVINSIQLPTSPLHHCQFLPGLLPWLLLIMTPLV